ncbi:Uncharacterised protein [Burkholderia pseudomallei]|uniref:hypothetical protein n=1 Tax=Burkholderia pseudomallei TaxID=28450 RepID=UPI000F160F14|nr:hypothetical protein [Burkholderia pseudomallei]VBS33527.1 Uncharacterised protein [Burkholderia pseudomallei]
MLVYLDHNILTWLVEQQSANRENVEYQQSLALLRENDTTVVLSAVSLYEIANSNNERHVALSIELLEELSPLWLSNSVYLQTEELRRYITHKLRGPALQPLRPLNTTMSQLWSTYGSREVNIGETVSDCIISWHRDRVALERVARAARETPEAIMVGRRALAEGFARNNAMIVDEEYYRTRLPVPSSFPVDIPARLYRDLPRLLAEDGRRVHKVCPAIKAEDLCQRFRVDAGFRPEPQDALDLQHSIGALAYCDYFVTRDHDIHAMFQYVQARWNHCPCVAVDSCEHIVAR